MHMQCQALDVCSLLTFISSFPRSMMAHPALQNPVAPPLLETGEAVALLLQQDPVVDILYHVSFLSLPASHTHFNARLFNKRK